MACRVRARVFPLRARGRDDGVALPRCEAADSGLVSPRMVGLNTMVMLEGGFAVMSWDEAPYDRVPDQPRFSHVRSVYELQGAIEGEASLCYLLAYADDIAHFTGFALVTATIGGRRGSFVMED